MILSYQDIEEIANAVVLNFNGFYFGHIAESRPRYARAMPIEQFAIDYLGLDISYMTLSMDGSILGLTVYDDTEYKIRQENGDIKVFHLKRNQVILDSIFTRPENVQRLSGMQRFTIAHECAHQILHQLETDDNSSASARKYAEHRVCSHRTLQTKEDWNEWQANALGAAILMPQAEVNRAMWYLNLDKPLVSYGGRFFDDNKKLFGTFCSTFSVSKAAAAIRLEQLGYLEKRNLSEYYHPLDVEVQG